MSQDNSESVINKVYDNFTKDKDSFNCLKLTGKNDTGLEETIDFIETLFTYTTQFEISEDSVVDSNLIKQKLADSLKVKQ